MFQVWTAVRYVSMWNMIENGESTTAARIQTFISDRISP